MGKKVNVVRLWSLQVGRSMQKARVNEVVRSQPLEGPRLASPTAPSRSARRHGPNHVGNCEQTGCGPRCPVLERRVKRVTEQLEALTTLPEIALRSLRAEGIVDVEMTGVDFDAGAPLVQGMVATQVAIQRSLPTFGRAEPVPSIWGLGIVVAREPRGWSMSPWVAGAQTLTQELANCGWRDIREFDLREITNAGRLDVREDHAVLVSAGGEELESYPGLVARSFGLAPRRPSIDVEYAHVVQQSGRAAYQILTASLARRGVAR